MADNAEQSDIRALRKRVRILVIDDQADAFPVESMRSRGYNVEYWPDVSVDNLARLERGEYDIVILDIRGVGKDISFDEGFAVLKRLKRVRPGLTVVAFSGATFDISESQFFELADDVLPKPVDVFTCEEKLDALLRQSLSFDELWEGLNVLLRHAGVGRWGRSRLRKKIDRAVKRGGERAPLSQRLRDLIPDKEEAQVAVNILSLLLRLYENSGS